MLDVTIRVTKSPVHLEQIYHIAIHNVRESDVKPGLYIYRVYLDGKECGFITHARADGALALLSEAMDAVLAKLEGLPPMADDEKENTD